MTRRTFKQITIGAAYLFLAALIGFLIYWAYRPDPSCSDGIKNQSEEEVDCGGPCLSCELMHIQDLQVEWSRVLTGAAGLQDVVVRVKNPNLNHGSAAVPYVLYLYDQGGSAMESVTGETFVLPGQTKYLIWTQLDTGLEPIARVGMTFGDIEWQRPGIYQASQLTISQKRYEVLPSGQGRLQGLLANNTGFDFEKIDIDVLLLDSFYEPLAVNRTEVRTLATGGERDFVAIWDEGIDAQQVAFIEVEPETNIFDLDNYLPSSRQPEPFQQY